MSRAGDLVQAFYEDANLRDSLTDDEAEVLLKWAAGQANRLDAEGADDAAFDELAGQLRRLVKQINHYAGEGLYTPPDEQAPALAAIAENAQKIGLTAAPAFQAQAAPADPMAALTGILASFSASETAPAESVAAQAEPAEAPATAQAESVPPVWAEPAATETAQPPAPPVYDEDLYDL